ncbi:MAG: tetratricopeptide repeat protein [Eudoraea sp.]|nr:tetratricopeptide repeat protein [Eudoraea sp.]
MRKWVLLLFVFTFSIGIAQNEVLFDSATKAYNEGNYQDAIDNYHEILKSGQHSAEVYFNLGNSYYKVNKIGPSIYYYEKALLLDPNDIEILNNLSFAQKMTIDAIEPLPQTSISRMVGSVKNILTFDQWAYTAVIFMFLFVLLYLAFYFFQFADKKRIAFIASMACLLVMAISILFAVIQYRDFTQTQPAIIFATETAVKEEPNNRSNTLFDLHEGSKVFVEEELNDWNKIRLADGKNGWIPETDLRILKDF